MFLCGIGVAVETMAYSRKDDLNASGAVEFQGHEGAVKNAMFTPDGQDLLSHADDGSIRCWSVRVLDDSATVLARFWLLMRFAIHDSSDNLFTGQAFCCRMYSHVSAVCHDTVHKEGI